MITIRWLDLYGSGYGIQMERHIENPYNQASAETIFNLESQISKARFGLLVDTSKTKLIAAYEDDINSWFVDGKVVPDELCECYDYVTEWDAIPELLKTEWAIERNDKGVIETVIENPTFKAVVVAGNKATKETIKEAKEASEFLDLPMYVMNELKIKD